MPEQDHQARIPDDVWEWCGRTSRGVVVKLYRAMIAERAAEAAADAGSAEAVPVAEPEPEPAKPVSGTLIVTGRRSRCPKCEQPVDRNVDAVMMDGTEYGYGPREAFHVDCAKDRGWVPPSRRFAA